jgi:hypothetical protein
MFSQLSTEAELSASRCGPSPGESLERSTLARREPRVAEAITTCLDHPNHNFFPTSSQQEAPDEDPPHEPLTTIAEFERAHDRNRDRPIEQRWASRHIRPSLPSMTFIGWKSRCSTARPGGTPSELGNQSGASTELINRCSLARDTPCFTTSHGRRSRSSSIVTPSILSITISRPTARRTRGTGTPRSSNHDITRASGPQS